MSKLNVSKANGPDGISNRVLKECSDSLAIPLTDLFNKSMDEGVFPSLWKMSNVSPVYKKAFRYLKENYRPVSLLSCMSKIMERIVYNALYNFFKVNGLLSERNSGLPVRQNVSTPLRSQSVKMRQKSICGHELIEEVLSCNPVFKFLKSDHN